MDLGYSIAGFFVGTLVGATGVGGGSLMTPILLLLFGVPATTAVGSDLLFASATKTVGTAMHGFSRSVSWRIVALLSLGSIPAAATTLWMLHNVFERELVSQLMTVALGAALLVTSFAILLQPAVQRRFFPDRRKESDEAALEGDDILEAERACEERPGVAGWTVGTGVVLGALVTLTSVGAGALGVMVLLGLYPKVRSVRIVGTDIAHAVPLTLVAGLGHASLGGVDFRLLGFLLLGSIPGVIFGSRMALRLPDRALKQSLAGILLLVGGKLLF